MTKPGALPPISPSCRSCCGGRRLFEHFHFSSNSGHIAALHEPTQWSKIEDAIRQPTNARFDAALGAAGR